MVFNQADGKMYFVQPISDSPVKQAEQQYYTQMTNPKPAGSKRPKTANYSQAFQQKNIPPRFVVSGVSPNQEMVEQPEVGPSSLQ